MTTKPGSFVRQAAILAAASLFVRFIGFLYRIPLTNLLGDDGIGIYTVAYNVYAFILISSGAIPAAVSRLVSERIAKGQYGNAHEMFKTAFGFALVAGSIAAIVLWVGAPHFAHFFSNGEHLDSALAMRFLAPAVIVVAMLAVLRGYFQGMKTAVPTAISQVVEQIFNVAFTVLLAFLLFDAANMQYAIAGAGIGTGIGAVAGLAVVAFLFFSVAANLRKRANADFHRYKLEPHYNESRKVQLAALLQTALPMIIGGGIYSISTIIDMRMINSRMAYPGVFSPDEIEVLFGQFMGKFILLTTLPVSLSMALSTAVIPEITSSSVQMDTDAVRHKTNMALRLCMILSIPSAVGLAVLAYPIIALLFPSHPGGGILLQVGAVSFVFISLTHVLTGTLQGLGHVRLPIIAAFFGVATKIPVNYFLIANARINVLGAVISTIVCFIVAAGIAMFFLYRKTGILPGLTGAIIKPLVSAIGMGMVCYVAYFVIALFAPYAVATVFALLAGMVSYVLFMCIIKGFRHSDLQAMPLPASVRRLLR